MSDKVIAHPSAACCAIGSIHEGEPKGRIEKILDVETYIAEPAADKANGNIILYFPDVFGLFNNARLMIDAWAEAGYLVLGPDYFRGDPISKHKKNFHDPNDNPNWDMGAWMTEKQSFADPFVPKWVEEVKKTYGKADTKYVCTGYCFGAPVSAFQMKGPAFLQNTLT